MRYIVGIDEVGRGSLAGPVVVAAVSIPQGLRINFSGCGKLRDSKKLTPQKREQWFKYIKSRPEVSFALARVYPRRIEKLNISKAANLAAFRAFCRLTTDYSLPTTNCLIYLDGGLYLGNQGRGFSQIKTRINADRIRAHLRGHPRVSATTVVRGDEKIKAITIASIIAKVHRDRLMTRLGKIYPKYGFEIHKGYGTKKHFAALKKHGRSKVHRRTFVSHIN